MADIVRDCTDTREEAQSGEKKPWLLRKTRYPGALANKPETSTQPMRCFNRSWLLSMS